MTIKVKTEYGGCTYITAGKVYEAVKSLIGKLLYTVICDDGDSITIRLKHCGHLNNIGSWEIVNNTDKETVK